MEVCFAGNMCYDNCEPSPCVPPMSGIKNTVILTILKFINSGYLYQEPILL